MPLLRTLALMAFMVLVLFGASFPARAQTLVLLSVNSAGRELLVDTTSLWQSPAIPASRPFAATQLRVEIRSPGGRRTGIITERILYSFDCRTRRVATLAYWKAAAARTRSHDWKGADWADAYEPVKPGTLADQALDFACSGGRLPVAPAPLPSPQNPDGINRGLEDES